jgi:hypothetical protein
MRIFPRLRWEVEPVSSSAMPTRQVDRVESSWRDTLDSVRVPEVEEVERHPDRLSESYGETSSNVPPRQVEPIESSWTDILDTVGEPEVEEVEPHPDRCFDSQTRHHDDLERSEENGHY